MADVRITDYQGKHTPGDVRDWARDQGLIPGRQTHGRLRSELVLAYAKAHRLRKAPVKG